MIGKKLFLSISCLMLVHFCLCFQAFGQSDSRNRSDSANDNSDRPVTDSYFAFEAKVNEFVESNLGKLMFNAGRSDEVLQRFLQAKSIRGVIGMPEDINRLLEASGRPPFDWYLEFELVDREAREGLEEWLEKVAVKENEKAPFKYTMTMQTPSGEFSSYYVIDKDIVVYATGFPYQSARLPDITPDCQKLLKASSKQAVATLAIDLKSAAKLMDSGEKLAEGMNQTEVLSWLETMRDAEGATVSLFLGDPNRVTAEIECNSEKNAKEIESLITKLASKGLESQRGRGQAEPMTIQILESMKTKVNGRKIELTASISNKVVTQAENAAERMMLSNNLKQIALSMHNFHAAMGTMPFQPQPGQDETLSWRIRVLPFINEEQLHSEFDFTQPWDSPKNRALIDKAPEIFGKDGKTNMRWIKSDIKSFEDITNGTSNTICFIYSPDSVPWTQNNDMTTFEALAMFAALKPDETIIASMYDGSVRVISRQMDVSQFEAMLIPRKDD